MFYINIHIVGPSTDQKYDYETEQDAYLLGVAVAGVETVGGKVPGAADRK